MSWVAGGGRAGVACRGFLTAGPRGRSWRGIGEKEGSGPELARNDMREVTWMRPWGCGIFFLILLIGVLGIPSAQAMNYGVRAYYWVTDYNADIRADKDGITGTTISLKNDLGMGNQNLFTVEAFAHIGNHHLSFQYTPVEYSGNTTLNKTILFNGKTYPVNSPTQSNLKFNMLDLEYQYDVLNFEKEAGVSLGVIGRVKYLEGDARLAIPEFQSQATFRATVPMIGLGFHWGILGNMLEFRAKVSGMAYSASNALFEGLTDLAFAPLPFVDIRVGYRLVKLDVDQSDVYLKSQFQGPYGAVSVGF